MFHREALKTAQIALWTFDPTRLKSRILWCVSLCIQQAPAAITCHTQQKEPYRMPICRGGISDSAVMSLAR
ncbi:hypothetical protein ACNKHT_26800 [Shigella flexneri]